MRIYARLPIQVYRYRRHQLELPLHWRYESTLDNYLKSDRSHCSKISANTAVDVAIKENPNIARRRVEAFKIDSIKGFQDSQDQGL